jgi:nitrogen fixation protein NifU and related proteins
MSDLSDLYQEILLEHNSKPRNFRKLEDADRSAEGYNPLCGDEISVFLKLDGDVVADVGFQGRGCAISRASASMMTQSIKGQKLARAQQLFEEFHKMLTQPGADLDYDMLEDLEMLAGVAEYPTRIKCAILAWHTLHAALEGQDDPVTTE